MSSSSFFKLLMAVFNKAAPSSGNPSKSSSSGLSSKGAPSISGSISKSCRLSGLESISGSGSLE